MKSYNLDQLRKCCENQKVFFIVYDGGPTPDLPVLVCKSCFEKFPIFQKFIKSKQSIENIPDEKLHKLLK